MHIAQKKCVPCEGGAEPLGPESIAELAGEVPDWTVGSTSIERTFTFADFAGAMRFADAVAEIAEKENHHPDLHISWGKVRVEVSTHSIGGLTENDFILAAKIDRLSAAGARR